MGGAKQKAERIIPLLREADVEIRGGKAGISHHHCKDKGNSRKRSVHISELNSTGCHHYYPSGS